MSKKRYVIKPNATFSVSGPVPDIQVSEREFRVLKGLADAEGWDQFDEQIARYYDGTWEEEAGICDAEVNGNGAPEFVVEGK